MMSWSMNNKIMKDLVSRSKLLGIEGIIVEHLKMESKASHSKDTLVKVLSLKK